jgi:hypothetical protein
MAGHTDIYTKIQWKATVSLPFLGGGYVNKKLFYALSI